MPPPPKNKTISFEKLEEKYFGKKGSPNREKYEDELKKKIRKNSVLPQK